MRASPHIALLAIFLAASPADAQPAQPLLELSGVGGYSAVDVDKWSGSGFVYDWVLAASGGSARLFFRETAAGRLGIEAGYRYHFWYELEIPYTTYYIYPDYDVESSYVSVILRRPLGPRMNLDVGAGVHFFEDFTDLGLHLGITRLLRDGPRFSVPLSIRFDPVLDSDAMILPLTVNLGLGIKLGQPR